MIELYRRQLDLWRETGLEIFVIPGPGEVCGMAYIEQVKPTPAHPVRNTRLHILMRGSIHSPLWLFVLLHEVAHHVRGDTTARTTRPAWLTEYETDMMALKAIRQIQPYVAKLCEQRSREHIRPMLQAYIDNAFWHHVDEGIADWAGCTLTPEARAALKPYHDDAGVTF